MKDQVSNACLVLTGGYKAVLIALALRVGGSEIAPRSATSTRTSLTG